MAEIACDNCGIVVERVNFCSARCKVRYYRSKGAHKNVPADLRWKVFQRDNFTCKRCGAREHLSLDHIVPQKKQVNNDLSNLQTLCMTCNRIKGKKDEQHDNMLKGYVRVVRKTMEEIMAPPKVNIPKTVEEIKVPPPKFNWTLCKHGKPRNLCEDRSCRGT